MAPHWTNIAVILCTVLIVIGAASLVTAAESFTIIKGRVPDKGKGYLKVEGKPLSVHTVSVLLENKDRVFRIEQGTIVTYAISDRDWKSLKLGSKVELFISAYNKDAKIIRTKQQKDQVFA